MENKLKDAVEKGSWSDRRLIMYLMGLKGAPGMLFKDYGKEGSLRLNALINLVNKGLIKIKPKSYDEVIKQFKETQA